MTMNALLISIAVIFSVFFVIGTVYYVFNSLGLYVIAKNRNIRRAALAWLPVFGTAYVTGAIADHQNLTAKGTRSNLRRWLVILLLVLCVLNAIQAFLMFRLEMFNPYMDFDPSYLVAVLLMLVVGLPFTVLWYVAHFRLFKSCQPANGALFLILSILFGIAPFLVFAVRNHVDGQRVS